MSCIWCLQTCTRKLSVGGFEKMVIDDIRKGGCSQQNKCWQSCHLLDSLESTEIHPALSPNIISCFWHLSSIPLLVCHINLTESSNYWPVRWDKLHEQLKTYYFDTVEWQLIWSFKTANEITFHWHIAHCCNVLDSRQVRKICKTLYLASSGIRHFWHLPIWIQAFVLALHCFCRWIAWGGIRSVTTAGKSSIWMIKLEDNFSISLVTYTFSFNLSSFSGGDTGLRALSTDWAIAWYRVDANSSWDQNLCKQVKLMALGVIHPLGMHTF